MKVSKSVSVIIESLKAKIVAKGSSPVQPQAWEQDDDGLMYANSLLEQLESLEPGSTA